VVARDGRILSFNRHAALLLGRPPDQVPPDHWPRYYGFYLDDGETYYPGSHMPLVRALQGEPVAYGEMILRPENASAGLWVAMTAHPLSTDRDSDDVDKAMVVFRDVSYRKQVEHSRERHATRAEAIYKLSRQITEVSDDVHQILNVSVTHAAEYIGDSCVAMLTNEANDRVEITTAYHPNPKSRALLRELIMSQEYDLEHGISGGVIRSGEAMYIPSISPNQIAAITLPAFASFVREVGIASILIVPLKGRTRVLGTLGMTRDKDHPAFTAEDQSFLEDMARRVALAIENCHLFESLRSQIVERRSAEKALQESEERLRSIFEGSALGIKVLDLDGILVQTNPALQNILGYSAGELTGRHFTEFIHPEDVNMSRLHLERLICGGLSKTYLEHRLLHRDGSTVWVRGTFAGVRDAGDADGYKFVVVMVENITESKKIAAELLEMKARLLAGIEMERLRLAQELHDGPMQDLHSTLYQMGGLRDRIGSDQQVIIDQVRSAISQVIQDLRATAKELRPPTIMDFGLEKAIRSHVEEFQDKYANLNIELILASDRQLLAEDVRLALFRIYQQSMMNIVRHSEATHVTVRFMLDAEEVTLEIEDNGKGFAVPNRWVTLTRKGHFGLAGAAERVETLGGEFRVFSEPGKGTRIYVRIPSQSRVWET
jgi:PAS domain S-box-containing protein